jgi:hypothetical protein
VNVANNELIVQNLKLRTQLAESVTRVNELEVEKLLFQNNQRKAEINVTAEKLKSLSENNGSITLKEPVVK